MLIGDLMMDGMTEGDRAIITLIAEEAADKAVNKIEPRLRALETRVYTIGGIMVLIATALGFGGEALGKLLGAG